MRCQNRNALDAIAGAAEMSASTITPVETRCIDGLWWASWNHPLLGYLDARGSTEQMAIANLQPLIRQAQSDYAQKRIAEFVARKPRGEAA